jgi:hypothetical protein
MTEQIAEQNEQAEMPNQQNREEVVTLVLTADNHLGSMAFSQHPRKREERLQRLRRAFQQATDFAITQGVDLFVQAGDLFDTTTPDEYDRSFVAERLAQLKQAGIQSFAIGGVHDTPTEGYSLLSTSSPTRRTTLPAPQMSYARLGALHYLSSASSREGKPVEPTFIDIRGIPIGICGLSVLAGQEGDPLERFHVQDDIGRAVIRLLVLHAPIEGLATGSSLLDTRALISCNSIARQKAFHCILAGYHHSYSHSRIGSIELIVAGATQHSDFSTPEHAPGFVFIGLGPDGVHWCNHLTVDTMPLHRVVIHTSELWTDDNMTNRSATPVTNSDNGTSPAEQEHARCTEYILERLRPLCSPDAMIQLKLEGELTRSRYHQLDLNQIRRYGEEHCFALAIDDSMLSLRSEQETTQAAWGAASDEIGERFSPREELVALVDEWIATADNEQEKKALRATKEELLLVMDEVKRRV